MAVQLSDPTVNHSQPMPTERTLHPSSALHVDMERTYMLLMRFTLVAVISVLGSSFKRQQLQVHQHNVAARGSHLFPNDSMSHVAKPCISKEVST